METQVLRDLAGFEFVNGIGDIDDKTLCIMSAVAYVAGEPHSDHPACACPVITEVAIRLNDGPYWANVAERTEALRPLAEKLVGTRSTPDVERRRAAIMVRAALTEFAPMALEHAADKLAEKFPEHAAKLRMHAGILRSKGDAADAAADAAATAATAAANAAATAAAYAAYAAAAAAAYAATAAAANAATNAATAAAYAAYAATAAAAYAATANANKRQLRDRLIALIHEMLAVTEED